MQYYARIVKTRNGVKTIVGSRKINRFDNTFSYHSTQYKLRTVEPSEVYDGRSYFYYDVTDNCQLTNELVIYRIRTNTMLSDIDSLTYQCFALILITIMLSCLCVGIMNGTISIGV